VMQMWAWQRPGRSYYAAGDKQRCLTTLILTYCPVVDSWTGMQARRRQKVEYGYPRGRDTTNRTYEQVTRRRCSGVGGGGQFDKLPGAVKQLP
jgi:hypothetical protein